MNTITQTVPAPDNVVQFDQYKNQNQAVTYPAPCPSCGHCPTCGRGKYTYPGVYPWVNPQYPYWYTISGGQTSNPLPGQTITYC